LFLRWYIFKVSHAQRSLPSRSHDGNCPIHTQTLAFKAAAAMLVSLP
jgi:hypothetical protein